MTLDDLSKALDKLQSGQTAGIHKMFTQIFSHPASLTTAHEVGA